MCDDSSGSDLRGGVVSARDVTQPTDPLAVSARGWVVEGYNNVDFLTYSELKTMYGYDDATTQTITDLSEIATHGPGVYKITTGYTIASSPCTLPAAVVFVDGNLDITTNFGGAVSGDPLTFKNNCNSSLAFIVSGNINIAQTVNNIYGLFYAEGEISTGSSSNPLYVFGSLLGGSFNLIPGRNLGADNATSPAEQIIYMPKYYLTLKDFLGHSQVSWKEVK